MLYRKNEYTVFLSYFGTYSPNGSKGLAMQAKAIIDKVVGGKSYCGPDEDDHTFLQHMDEVIPSASLFLLVINDSCPQSSSGAISQKSVFMIKEIEAFVTLVRQGERSPKDFAVLYVGNLLFDMGQKIAFAQTLLQEVDPDRLLSSGNHHFILDFESLPRWVDIRLKQPAQDLSSVEEQPATFLQDAVDSFMESHKKGLFLIEMDEGMGKTTFVRQQERRASLSDASSPFFFYINAEKNYSQLVDFALELYQKISDGLELTQKRRLHHLDTFQSDMGQAFSDFINNIKTAIFPEEKIVLYLDAIDLLGSVGGKTILDYFKRVDIWADGIYLVATKRTSSYSQTIVELKALEGLVQSFTVQNSEVKYRRFLRQYFHTHIAPKLEYLGINSAKEILSSIQPQTMLMFSLYNRILSIYSTEHKETDGCYEDIKDVEAIIAYYFKVLQSRYSSKTFMDYKRMLFLLATASTPLDLEDVQYLITKGLLDGNYLDESSSANYLFRVFTVSYVEKDTIHYTLIHDGIKKLLDFDWQLMDTVNSQLYDLLLSTVERHGKKLESLFTEGKTLLNFVKPLLNSDTVEADEKDELLSLLSELPFEAGWDKTAGYRVSEEQLIRVITDFRSNAVSNRRKAYCLTVLGNDLYIDGRVAESDLVLQAAVEIYDSIQFENLSDADRYEYQELKSLVSTCAQALGDSKTAVNAYEQLVQILKELHEKGYPRADSKKYVRNIACLGHVYGHAKLFEKQIATLEQAEALYDEFGLDDITITTFILFGKAYFYFDTGAYQQAFETATRTIENYLCIHEKMRQQFYYGDILDCTRLRFEIILAFDPLQSDSIMRPVLEQYRLLQQMQRQDGEYNYLYNIGADEALAKLQFKLEKRREAMALCTRIIELIETNKLDIDDDYFMTVKQRVIDLGKAMEAYK